MAEQNGAAELPASGGAIGDSAAPRDSRDNLSKPTLNITAAQLAGQTAMAVALSAASEPDGPPSPGSPSDTRRQSARNKTDKQKLGHRRVREGEVTYKKIQTSTIMGAIQLGISYALGSEASRPRRDVLLSDFYTIETVLFPSQGSQHTPAHHYSEFRFKIYATIGFKYFRNLFGIRPDDFLVSMCNEPLRELVNAGASGSIFYLTLDDEFIVKTVQHKEGELLLKLLPAYFMNLNQNPRTLLPKFFGLYCYQCNSKNIRLVVMNNILPSSVKMHQRYDLKGSTYKRKANKHERAKKSPTYKDLDFMEHHPEGLMLEATTYLALIQTIQNDVRVLESFQIMDYSLLVGVHNLDVAAKERTEAESAEPEADAADGPGLLSRSRSINRQRLVAHSTAMESIQAESEPIDDQQDVPPGGIPARNSRGERLLLFLGIIDILQSYRAKKRLEHTLKSLVHDGNTISVHRPDFYAKRFTDFMGKTVFQKIPSPLRHSPSKRKGQSLRMRALDNERKESDVPSEGRARQQGRPTTNRQTSALGGDTKPVPGGGPLQQQVSVASSTSHTEQTSPSRHVTQVTISGSAAGDDKNDSISVSDIQLDARHDSRSSLSVDSGPASSGGAAGGPLRHVTWTPPMSVEGSTPTWTEGTPSFTESSSSGDIGCPTTPVKSLHASRDSGVNTMPYTKLNNADNRPPAGGYTETEMTSVSDAPVSPVGAVSASGGASWRQPAPADPSAEQRSKSVTLRWTPGAVWQSRLAFTAAVRHRSPARPPLSPLAESDLMAEIEEEAVQLGPSPPLSPLAESDLMAEIAEEAEQLGPSPLLSPPAESDYVLVSIEEEVEQLRPSPPLSPLAVPTAVSPLAAEHQTEGGSDGPSGQAAVSRQTGSDGPSGQAGTLSDGPSEQAVVSRQTLSDGPSEQAAVSRQTQSDGPSGQAAVSRQTGSDGPSEQAAASRQTGSDGPSGQAAVSRQTRSERDAGSGQCLMPTAEGSNTQLLERTLAQADTGEEASGDVSGCKDVRGDARDPSSHDNERHNDERHNDGSGPGSGSDDDSGPASGDASGPVSTDCPASGDGRDVSGDDSTGDAAGSAFVRLWSRLSRRLSGRSRRSSAGRRQSALQGPPPLSSEC